MFELNYLDEKIWLDWYVQDLITGSLESMYGQELLTRVVASDSNQSVHVNELFDYLVTKPDLLLAMTCQQLRDLFINKRLYHKINQSIWVNISGTLITNDELFSSLWSTVLCNIRSCDKQQLVLEICEDSINDVNVVERIKFLKSHDFKVAMDDFGAGQSNLTRLSQVNFDFIKLDLQLIKNIPDDLWATSLYMEIVSLCSSKGALIVAEGIETKAQSDFVRWAGVDIIQGFLYSKPHLFA